MKNILDNAMIPKKFKGFFVEIGVKSQHSTLRKKCPHSELFWSEYGKMRTRITPNMDTFHAVFVCNSIVHLRRMVKSYYVIKSYLRY